MPRKKARFLDLKKPRLRQSWHPINLYNLSRQEPQSTSQKSFFQQKWAAKSLTRAYHGEQIREGQWELQFSRRIPSVVPMDSAVLAKSDGSDMAAGRGSGRDERRSDRTSPKVTPYMNMTFFPQERRLDTCIFRALFASSTRQARQMVTHGHVRVNGKKMIYPGYLLNSGDMFSVDPEMVMYCTGEKPRMNMLRHRLTHFGPEKKSIVETYRAPFFALLRSVASLSRVYQARVDANKTILEELQQLREEMTPYTFGADTAPGALYTSWKMRFDSIRNREPLFDQEYLKAAFVLDSILLRLTKQIERSERKLEAPPPPEPESTDPESKPDSKFPKSESQISKPLPSETLEQLAQLRTSITSALRERITVPLALSFRDTYRKILSPTTNAAASTLTDTYTSLLDPLFVPLPSPALSNPNGKTREQTTGPITTHLKTLAAINFPWESKNYMSAFAFIPRYLEVNQNVCSAVYLRHPVARPGLAEVPSPFGEETQTLAFQWYLRRR